jgi:hypothetical protein
MYTSISVMWIHVFRFYFALSLLDVWSGTDFKAKQLKKNLVQQKKPNINASCVAKFLTV